ncbi:Copper binding protein, plastocyanin/azurin family [Halobiforma haloterrestris]|uniref:Copper binding protein, plastocyanin/azurin family n=1 Tax=Natronobacterium haloterrestre TaxID=148448 RepID=A0A1I1GA09_NATHA|nr:plastocyanin/azurin family copper-binding protein [Halobiforma haloterrestris]SFC06163.1 Copper binding protein, plastocyanin/azurin family [Halobiforma haloterrestris]
MTDDNESNRGVARRALLAAGGTATVGALAGRAEARGNRLDEHRETDGDELREPSREVTARQEPGNAFYWVLPGERRLSPQVFGTPENPRRGSALLESRIEQAKGFPEPLGDAIPQLLEDLPPLVAAPEAAREPIEDEDENEDGIAQERFTEPTLYSDEAEVTSGAFEITYRDRQPYDLPGGPDATTDSVELEARFTDPAGNEYELRQDHVVQPPIPGYETGGGVLTGGWLHGISGTGSPLLPEVYTHGASWGVGDVVVNGEVATEDGFRLIHFMTTQTVRDERYRMVLDEELPLAPDETIAGRIHHTHGVVLPIRPTPEGPVYDPVPTAMELPNGETQPFIHAMWEQEELVDAPFQDWEYPDGRDEPDEQDGDDAGADFQLLGDASAWQGVAPDAIAGEENPTLRLEAGTEYELTWENADGLQHNFSIEDEGGSDLQASELLGEEGATQTVTVTATAEMSEYYCQVHPGTMRGSIEVED